MEPGPLGWAARMAVEMDRRVVSPRVAMVLGGGELEGKGGGDWGRGVRGGRVGSAEIRERGRI